jgi:hypothetical protein
MTDQGTIEIMARALHKLDCDRANAERRREGLPEVETWADPWHPCGSLQRASLECDARAVLRALSEAGYAVAPEEPTEAMHDAARDWSIKKYGAAIGIDASQGCYRAMLQTAKEDGE